MPNWCENSLLITSKDKSKIEELYKVFVVDSGEKGIFERFIPTPPELLSNDGLHKIENVEDLKKLYGSADWYSWRVSNWGTKWDITDIYGNHDAIVEHGDYWYFICSFDSAWAPPENGIAALSGIYKGCYFYLSFQEPGMGFMGYYSAMNGEELESETVNMIPSTEDVENCLEFYAQCLDDDEESSENV